MDKKPQVGDIVHYIGILKQPWAAMIVAVNDNYLVRLCVFNPISDPQVKIDLAPFSETYKLNHWSWLPEELSVFWQACPACNGTGIVYNMLVGMGPPPNSAGHPPATQFKCATCNGERIIRTDSGLPPSMQGKRNESK